MALVSRGIITSNIPENGSVFMFGGHSSKGTTINIDDETIIQLSCGDAHSALLCASGHVYMFGSNEYAQLGLGFISTKEQPPTLLSGVDDITLTQVACGGIHTLFLTADCQVLACGGNGSGQLGHGYVEGLLTPVLVHSIEDVVQIAAAGSHSAALTASGQAFVWGDNSWSQLAVCASRGSVRSPTLLALSGPVAHIACGSYHTAFITVSGKLFVCGSNFAGQLGTAADNPHGALHEIRLGSPVTGVACGARHSVAYTVGDDVWAWGDNQYGQVGCTGNDTQSPQLIIRGQKVVQVACGALHTALLTESGKLYMFGQGRDYQLSPGVTTDCFVPTMVEIIPYKIVLVACGRSVTLILSNGEDLNRPARQATPARAKPIISAMDSKLRKTLQCPSCTNYLKPPIYLCVRGHSICHKCSRGLNRCPECSDDITNIRNVALEALGPLAPHVSTSCLWCQWTGDHKSHTHSSCVPPILVSSPISQTNDVFPEIPRQTETYDEILPIVKSPDIFESKPDLLQPIALRPESQSRSTVTQRYARPVVPVANVFQPIGDHLKKVPSEYSLSDSSTMDFPRPLSPLPTVVQSERPTHVDHVCTPDEVIHLTAVEPLLDGFLRSETIDAFGLEFFFIHHYVKERKMLFITVNSSPEQARNFAYKVTFKASNSLTRATFQRQVYPVPDDPWDLMAYRPLDCFYVPKALLVNFMEYNQLKHCTLDIMRIKGTTVKEEPSP